MKRVRDWNGMCPAGKHGLDYEGQACDRCHPAPSDARYAAWIAAYVAQHKSVRGLCDSATKAMVIAFPELRRAAGFAHTTWGPDQHWWCVAPDGSVVDPTAAQFPVVFRYEELDLDNPADAARVPTGVCADCGDPVYGGKSFCSAECQDATAAYLGCVLTGRQY